MELSRQRKVLIALASVGLGALAVDRLLLGGGSGPASAAASGAEPGSGSNTTPPASNEPPTADRQDQNENPARTPLLHQMKALPEAHDYQRVSRLDAFRPPQSWIPEPVIVEDDPPEIEPDRRGELFAEKRLTAILSGPLGDYAVIGGRTFRLGDELDGFTLIAIHERSATFRAPPVEGGEAVEVTLSLPEPSARPRR